MATEQTSTDEVRQRLLQQVAEEYQVDFEARQSLMGLILRVVDEIRVGLRDLDLEELQTLAHIWRDLNDGVTPAEVAGELLPQDNPTKD